MQDQRNIKREIGAYVFLVILTATVFWSVRAHDFINYDDQLYITSNRHVQAGLTAENVKWAFTELTGEGHTYWHPLTWLSHMLDIELFKKDAGKHHLVSLGFHIANVLLLFTLLCRITGGEAFQHSFPAKSQSLLTSAPTGAWWRSLLVAILFALHPLQVDSVAWLAERKNLLSTFFGLLTMLCYAAFAQKKNVSTYILALLCFALTLMSKPFVTLPCVLLLLDFWPLKRVFSIQYSVSNPGSKAESFPRLILEKLPFFALSITSGVITILSHKKLALITEAHHLPLSERLANSVVSYWRYVRKTFWPNDLAVYYPLPDSWPMPAVIGAACFVIGVSALAFWWIKKRPYLFTGWFWFFGTLVPFIGLLQVNDQAMADRFAYVPLIGLFIALVWGGTELLNHFSLGNNVKFSAATVAVLATAWATKIQVDHWKNSETLFRHAIRVSESNIAHINYAAAMEAEGSMEKLVEAKQHYERALALIPNNSMAESNLGVTLAKLGQINEAMPHFLKAVEINPENADAQSNLGLAYTYLKRPDDALKALQQAVRIEPDHSHAQHNLANVLAQQGRLHEALPHYTTAVQLQPENAEAQFNLGLALLKLGRSEEAKRRFDEVLRLRPDWQQKVEAAFRSATSTVQ